LDAEMKRQLGRLRKEPCRWPIQATKSPSADDQLKNLHQGARPIDKIIKHKAGLLNLAEELGNVSKSRFKKVDSGRAFES